MAADQLTFAPTFIAVFFIVQGYLDGKRIAGIKERLRLRYRDTLNANYMIWPWVQLANFTVVPLQYRVLLANLVALGWNVYLTSSDAKATYMKH